MHVIDKNDDGETYRYALRFDVSGVPIAHDPEVDNGGEDPGGGPLIPPR